MSLRGIVVSHTHWDRAWYLPFERFRVRLVRMVDRLLDLLEGDPAFRAFTLDGQTVLLEDYFDVRPESEPRVRALVGAGRLVVGPFYVLPDLFLVSGESLIRNLQRGFAWRDRLGSPDAPVGYVPDPFGQPEAMPTLLRGFGVGTFFLSRGVSEAHKAAHGTVFRWRGPDGADVLAVYGRDGYFNAAALGHAEDFGRFDGAVPSPELAVAQLGATAARLAPLQRAEALLFLNGFDHMPEGPGVPALLGAVRGARPAWSLRHGTLADYFDAIAAEAPSLSIVTGDLVGNADHPVLQSVYSTRLYLKRANHAAQHGLTQVAEPVCAALPAGPDARPMLGLAWRHVLQNHPHDDLCGCSVDAVHLDDEARARHAREVTDELLRERLETLVLGGFAPADAPAGQDVFVFNPHPYPRRLAVEAVVLFPNAGGEFGAAPAERALAGADGEGRAVAVTVLETAAPVLRNHFLEATWGRRYRVRFEADVPPLGYTLVRVFECDGNAASADGERTGGAGLENAHFRLEPDGGDGFALTAKATGQRLAGALRIAWERDAGDTYSFGPVAGDAPRFARLVSVRPARRDASALVATYALDVPRRLGSAQTVTLQLRAVLRLEGERGVAATLRYRNRARDGRLRVLFPTGVGTAGSLAGAHFGPSPRVRPDALTPESAPERYAAFPGELVYTTHPSEDFVLVEGEGGEAAEYRVWVAHRGLPEYELVDEPGPDGSGATHVAVTVCRSVGALSVKGGRIRRVAAGPGVPTPGAQCLRPMGGALLFGAGAVPRERAMQYARTFAHPAWALELPHLPHAPAAGPHPRAASWLALDTEAVWLSAFRPETGGPGVVVRLVNPTGAPQTVTVRLGVPAARRCRADLHERWDESGAVPVEGGAFAETLGPRAVATWVVR